MRKNFWCAAAVAALMLSGMAGSASAQVPPPPPPGKAAVPSSPPRFHDIISRMSPEGRAIMAEAVKKGAPEKKNWYALKETREQILEIIAAPQLDEDALGQAFERERVLSQKHQAGRHEALLQAARQLSPTDRKLFAEGLRSTKLHIPGEAIKHIKKQADQVKKSCPHNKAANK